MTRCPGAAEGVLCEVANRKELSPSQQPFSAPLDCNEMYGHLVAGVVAWLKAHAPRRGV